MEKLTEIANKYNCDKGTKAFEAHGYTEEYAKYIPQEGRFTLLEIGIWHGDSLKMWHEYNPDLHIDAIDIDVNVLNYISWHDNLVVHIGDQGSDAWLENELWNNYDFVIDDGSHRCDDIYTSYKYLYPKLKLGGYYFIEDLHAQQSDKMKLIETISSLYNFKNKGFACNGKLWVIQKM